jgi:hypothetical protein
MGERGAGRPAISVALAAIDDALLKGQYDFVDDAVRDFDFDHRVNADTPETSGT